MCRSQPVTLDASGSSSVGTITTYEWDLDNDGTYDVSVGTPTYQFAGWSELGAYIVGLRVTDDGGRTDTDTVTITVVPNVDLTIADLTWLPATDIDDGDGITFTAQVNNEGTDNLAQGFSVAFYIDDVSVGSSYVSGLAAGSTTEVTQGWDADAGTHTVKAVADYNNQVFECNEDNNTFVPDPNLPPIPFPDLTITSLTWSPATDISDGDMVTFTAIAENIGTGNTSTDFYVRFEIDDSYIGHELVSGGLAAGGTIEVNRVWQ
ncbi:CARDB domain-containing protein, partial [Chloroflexota bacterium]